MRPNAFSLAAAYPNPSNGSVVLGYTLPEAALVRLDIFDVLGQRVATVVDESRSAGQHRLRYDTSVLASGLYLYRLSALGQSASRRVVVIK